MGNSYSYTNSTHESDFTDNDTLIEQKSNNQQENLNDIQYIYLVNYNDEFYFTRNNNDIIDLVASIKENYVKLALNNWSLYNYHIYEKVKNTYQSKHLDDTSIENLLNETSSNNNSSSMTEIYSLDVSRSIKHIIIHVETTLEKIKIYKVYNLSNIFETINVPNEGEAETNTEKNGDINAKMNDDINMETNGSDEVLVENSYFENQIVVTEETKKTV